MLEQVPFATTRIIIHHFLPYLQIWNTLIVFDIVLYQMLPIFGFVIVFKIVLCSITKDPLYSKHTLFLSKINDWANMKLKGKWGWRLVCWEKIFLFIYCCVYWEIVGDILWWYCTGMAKGFRFKKEFLLFLKHSKIMYG